MEDLALRVTDLAWSFLYREKNLKLLNTIISFNSFPMRFYIFFKTKYLDTLKKTHEIKIIENKNFV